ncbi:MAG: hypothetical protein JXA18_15535 [Chitinispirillaceae bacterium]|nr:hypothetical protein [Chitinispirillaceae bacterium]
MKKRSTVLVTALSLLTVTAAVTPVCGWYDSEGSCYAKGDMIGSLGLSVHYFGAYGSFDYGVHDCISAGGAVGYVGYSLLDARHNHIPLIVRGAFHPFNLAALADKIVIRDVIDVYAGLSTGWLFVWIRRDNLSLQDEADKPGFRIREYIGMRYHFSPKWSFFIEDCGYLTNIAGGVSYKF